MNNYNQPYLEKYTGRESRHKCPKCGDPHSFVYYLDGNTGQPIDESCGRCNHENSCGYHYTPKEFFIDNPGKRERTVVPARPKPATPQQERKPGYIPFRYVEKSASYKSDFVYFLCSVFDRYTLESPTIERMMRNYALGATRAGEVIFWQIDTKGKVRTGRIMKYNPNNGHWIKGTYKDAGWIHFRMKRQGLLPEDFNLVQCLFGEHLLRKYPDEPVALVESEKTALVGSAVFPQYIWLATGGKSQLPLDKMKVLRGRTVTMFPDAGCFEDWSRRAREIETVGCRVYVSDIVEKNATDEERARGIDIADWIIRQLQAGVAEAGKESAEAGEGLSEAERALQAMIRKNPAVQTLIDTFDLKLVA